MLPDVIVGLRLLVDPVALEPGVWHVLLVDTPADTLGLEKVDDGLCARTDPLEAVIGDPVGVGSSGRDIVRLVVRDPDQSKTSLTPIRHTYLRRMSDGKVVAEENTLACEVGQVGWRHQSAEVTTWGETTHCRQQLVCSPCSPTRSGRSGRNRGRLRCLSATTSGLWLPPLQRLK